MKALKYVGYVIGGLPISMMGNSVLDDAKKVAARGANRRVFIGYSPPDAANLKADTFAAPLSSAGSTFNVKQMEVKDDDHNTYQGVAVVLARFIPGVTVDSGLRIADKIHRTGSSIVWTGHKELAEHYWEQLQDAGLTMAPLEQA